MKSSSLLGLGLLISAMALAWLTTHPPHALDLAVSQPFYQNGVWFSKRYPWMELVGHLWIKWIPILIALYCLVTLVRAWRAHHLHPRPETRDRLNRAAFILVGLLITLLAVVILKRNTGVACPWSSVPFGGEAVIRAPSWPWHKLPGNCWPSGHAGTGFCLMVMYYAWRDTAPRKAWLWLAFALAFGVFCSVIRIMQGAHFFSHCLATFLIDWLILGVLYYAWRWRWPLGDVSTPRSSLNN